MRLPLPIEQKSKVVDETLTALKKVVNNVEEVLSLVNGDRSCLISFTNETSKDLHLLASHHQQGGFSVLPPSIVKARTAVAFTSRSKAVLMGTGTKGSVTYKSNGLEITLSWKNPFVGSNDSAITLAGPNHAAFEGNATPGIGNKQASMNYALFAISE